LIFRAVEDTDLIRQARRGSVESYNLLVSRWEKRVYNYLLRITGNREDALDLAQDVFLKAYQNLRKLDDPGRFKPWLYRIAHNEAYSLFRKRKPEADSGELEPQATDTGISVGATSVFPLELSLAVASALGRLSPEQREAVVLKIYQGFKFDEMAEILSCPVSTVKSRLYTALELLKAALAPISPRGVWCVMSCSPFDLRDYHLKELTGPQQRQVEAHVKDCAACREELQRLSLIGAALFSLRDEEIPQRIAFVSDPVFEPSRARRWWSAFWGSSGRLGFAAAAMLSAALIFTAMSRPPDAAISSAEVDRRIARAVDASEVRQTTRTAQLVHDLAQRAESEHNLRLAAEEEAKFARDREFAMEKDKGGLYTPASN
jgi:RNA polymerase sigma-70 factor (ECF subfamily)